MEFNISNFKCQELKNGKFVKPCYATFELNGQKRDWEIVKASDSVAILIYNSDKKALICVKQFRPAVYMQNGYKDGLTIELCAGILDKDISIEETASEEILEECGYKIEANRLEKITSFYTSVGFAGARQHLFYAEVKNCDRVSDGGGVEGEELIEVVEIPLKEAKELMYNESIAKTPGLLFAFNWFLAKENI